MWEYENFTQCYIDLARKVYLHPDYESAPRGMKIKERLACSFKIKNPRERIPFVPARNFSNTYLIGELLWYFSGDNSTEWISKYSSFWKNISDDGETANSAYGSRIFRTHPRIAGDQLIQWDYVRSELSADSDSRRAVVHIRSPWDSTHAKLDVPCTLTLQFFIRDEKLHMVVNMRSSDLILGIAYDVPAFTMMQELLAKQLGVGLGEYMHTSNSLHIYERHFEMVEKMISVDDVDLALAWREKCGAMPPIPNDWQIERLYEMEANIASAPDVASLNGILVAASDLDSYWCDWVKVLAANRCKKLRDKQSAHALMNSTNYSGFHDIDYFEEVQ